MTTQAPIAPIAPISTTSTASTASPAIAGTAQAIIDAYARAHERAQAAKLVAYKLRDGVYAVPSSTQADVEHTCVKTGARWYDWSCTCAGGNHVACLHRATALHAYKYHVHAVRAAAAVEPEQAPAIAAASRRVETIPAAERAHVFAATSTLVAGDITGIFS